MLVRPIIASVGATALLTAVSCTSDEWPIDPDDYAAGTADGSSGTGTDGDAVVTAAARVEIFEPESASIHFLGDAIPLIAEVTDSDGSRLDVSSVRWSADDLDFAIGTNAMDAVDLPAGIYDITAEVEGPAGTTVAASVGGVRVQSPNTGVYAGEVALSLTVDLQGMALTPVCRGATSVQIDMEGETLTAEAGQCTLDLLLLSFPADFAIDAVLYGNAVSGEITYTFAGLFSTTFQFEGTLFDDTLFSGFVGELAIPLIATAPANGTFVASKLSPYVEP